MTDLSEWKPKARPERRVFEGRHVRLEPLDPARHGDGLFEASSMADAEARFRYLPDRPPESREAFAPWLEKAASSEDPIFFAVVDQATGRIVGRQTLMRIDAANGVAEIGNIFWSSLVARTPGATEALHLFAAHVFDDLGYRRFEWKCDNANEPSKRAARRFGFRPEGVFRQHMVIKGRNRDTAWFSMLDHEWPALRKSFEVWLDPANFNADGTQRCRLEDFRAETD